MGEVDVILEVDVVPRGSVILEEVGYTCCVRWGGVGRSTSNKKAS